MHCAQNGSAGNAHLCCRGCARRDPLPAEAAFAAADTVVQRLLELPDDGVTRQFYAAMILASVEERFRTFGCSSGGGNRVA